VGLSTFRLDAGGRPRHWNDILVEGELKKILKQGKERGHNALNGKNYKKKEG